MDLLLLLAVARITLGIVVIFTLFFYHEEEKMNTIKNKGFTIIELMIAVAIIGILAAIAIPAYSNYTNKAKIGASIAAAAGAQTAVGECVHTNGNVTGCNSGVGSIPNGGLLDANTTLGTITNGAIVLTLTTPSGTVTLTPTVGTNSTRWTCTAAAGGGTPAITSAMVPSNCNGNLQ